MKFQLNYLKILIDVAVKVLHLVCQQFWRSQQWLHDWKIMFKLLHNCPHFSCQLGYAQNLPSRQASAECELRPFRCTSWVLKMQRNQGSNCQHSLDHRESKGISTFASASLATLKPSTVWITANWKILRDGNTRPPYLETCMWVKKQQLELDVEQLSRLGKEHDKALHSHPAYLTYVQSASCKMLGWMHHKLISRQLGEPSITSDMQMIPL